MAHDLIRLMHALFLPAAETCREQAWRPAADVYRTEEGWLIKFELAGVRPQDLEVGVLGNRLVIRGRRRDLCAADPGCRHYHLEIDYSPFERAVELPLDLEEAHITTRYENGMLLVRIQSEEA